MIEKHNEKKNAEKNSKKEQPRGKFIFVTVFIFLLVGLCVFSFILGYNYTIDRYENPITSESISLDDASKSEFKIEKGSTTDIIAKQLKKEGFIKSTLVYRLFSKFNGYDGTYKSGVHILSKNLSDEEIMVILSSEPETVSVTFPEGFTVLQIAERLEANNVCGKDEFLAAVNTLDYSSYDFLDTENSEADYVVEGYLFPDTYKFEIESEPETIIYKMLNRFSEIFSPEYEERLANMGLGTGEAVIIASYVEKEAKLSSERETIAGVYYNRLKSEDFPYLQCDATVYYVLKKYNIAYGETLTAENLAVEDKYNTYTSEGLTPGAICNPGEASIKAVVQMDGHEYYYYVLKNDGTGAHAFAETLTEHEENILKYGEK